MKKGLRPNRVLFSSRAPPLETSPDEEGIKTSVILTERRRTPALETSPDEEGIKTIEDAIVELPHPLETSPDEEGIKTGRGAPCAARWTSLETSPDEEGIKTIAVAEPLGEAGFGDKP